MITNIENKKDTTKIVSLADIMEAIKKAKEDNQLMIKQLTELFLMDETVELEVDSTIYKYIKRSNKDHCVNFESIMVSYVRALTDNNHEMKSKLKEYLFKYISNIKEDIDNEYIENIIEDDKILLKYIKESDTVENYVDLLGQKGLKKQGKTNITNFHKNVSEVEEKRTRDNQKGLSFVA